MKAQSTSRLLTKLCLLVAALLFGGRGTAAAGVVTEWGQTTGLPDTTVDITAIAAGADHTLALTAGGLVQAWGSNNSGQLNLPFEVQEGGIVAVAAGNQTSYALKSDGRVSAWGNGGFFLNWSGISSLSARGLTVAGVTSGGTVLVNNGTSPPPGLSGVTQVAVGGSHLLARRGNGTVVAWGSNLAGQTNVPVGLTGVTAVAAGFAHSLALKSDGTVIAWGAGGSSSNYGQAVVPAGLTGVSAIAAGSNHSLALKSNGVVVGWGDGSSGQLVPPAGLGALQAIAAEGLRSVAIFTPVPDLRVFQGQRRIPDGVRHDFGVVNPGASVSRSFAIVNYGQANLALSSLMKDGLDAARFSVSPLSPTLLPPGGSTAFTVTFSPTTAGPCFAALHLASNDPDEPVLRINLTGRTLLAAAAWPGNQAVGAMPDGLTDLREVSASGTYGAVLRGDGTILSWGGDQERGFIPQTIPAQAVTMAQGAIRGAMVKADGSVWTWDSQFGYESQILSAGSGITRIAAGTWHFLFMKPDGTLSGWGDNDCGQLNIPAGLSDLVAFSAGSEHSLVATNEGRVLAWGRNNHGQLNVPADLRKVVDVAAGSEFSLALSSDGTVTAWGDNAYGQLSIPPGLSGVIAVAARDIVALALKSDGSVVSWGYAPGPWPAALGRVGVMAAGLSSLLALVTPTPRAEISAEVGVIPNGAVLDFSWTPPGTPLTKILTIRNRGTLALTLGPFTTTGAHPGDYAVSVPGTGIVAPGGQTTVSVTFAPTAIGARLAELNLGTNDPTHQPHRIALVGRTPMAVASWGWNISGQTDPLPGLGDVVALAAGYNHSLALRSNGTVVAWGENRDGQTHVPAGLANVKAIAAGHYHSLALKTDGSVVGWGLSSYQVNPPPALTGIKAIAGGGYHSLALTHDGHVLGWGLYLNGRTEAPAGLAGVALLAAGLEHSLVSRTDELGRPEVFGFGGDTQGQLAARLVTATAMACGDYHNLVLQPDGTVIAWGANQFGQSTVPAGLSGVTALSAGIGSSAALKSDGTANLWGLNAFGKSTLPAGLGPLGGITAGGWHTLALVSPMPDVAVTYGINRVEDGGTVGFGVSGTSGSDVRTFTVLNRGTLPLTGLALTKNGADAASFSFTPPGTPTLAPGASTTFTVTFSTTAAGNRSAALQLASNDPDEATYDIALNGSTGLTPLEVWRQIWFGLSSNAGEAWNESDPDGDLVANFVEFAFGTDPTVRTPMALRYAGPLTGGGTLLETGSPVILYDNTGNATVARGAWVRRRDAAASSLAYTPQVSADLTAWTSITTPPAVLSSDSVYEVAALPLAALPHGKVPRFFRLIVTVPP